MTSPTSLVFFGTGPVSLASLEALADHFTIEAIITKPDYTAPNGQAVSPLVKTWGEANKIPVIQLANKQELSDYFSVHKFESQLGLVVDYGLIIPQSVIDYFELGILNSHFSLLPRWRGADPITAAILAGDDQTGVTVQRVVYALDEGQIIAQTKMDLPPDITTPDLTDHLIDISNQLLVESLPRYVAGKLKPQNQDSSIEPTYSRKLTKADGLIDWTKSAEQIEREVRAYFPWPGSKTKLAGLDVTITKARVGPTNIMAEPELKPGDQIELPGIGLVVACGGPGCKESLVIERLKPAGKRDMSAQEFLAGHKLT